MKRLFSLLLLAVLLLAASAKAQDEQYVRIYGLIQDGDSLKVSQPAAALAKYREAQSLLAQFQRAYPDWNSNVVKYRLSYLAVGIAEITTRHLEIAAPATNAVPVPEPAQKPETKSAPPATTLQKAPGETEVQLTALHNQVRQLQNDNSLLESKLKEALRVQPANLDPNALARAEEEVKRLTRENSLLKSTGTNGASAASSDAKLIEQLKHQVASANLRIAEQAERTAALAAERTELQKKMDSMIPAAWNATNIETLRKSLDDTKRKLAEQTEIASKVSAEKSALQDRIKNLTADAETAAALRSENEILKKQLNEAKAAPRAENEKLARDLAEARAQIALLQSDQNVLRLEKAALEKRAKEVRATAATPTVITNTLPPVVTVDTTRVKELERERDELQQKYESAQKELLSLRSKPGTAKIEDLQNEIQILRTRLAVMETQKMPYSDEEAELIRKSEAQLVDPRAGKKSSRDLPPGSMALVAEAQKDFAARRFDQAEQKYLQVLKQDEKNVYTLANLAAIQIEMGRLDQAEKNIKQALAVAPDDAYSLSLLGFLKFRQNKFDDALDALGRAAKLDPQNAEIQNYLGLTLGQKGMRNAAESALRKAVTLDPNYGSAHYNLAVIYLTQKPQQVELAR
ncbi:MAG TPA: tetratricopeptide repeat protein, partial [Candidatus Paceibacterota bacterium]|nr:tetratricopeptide repeat protein [Candidatus Paceibacterota bacterium]